MNQVFALYWKILNIGVALRTNADWISWQKFYCFIASITSLWQIFTLALHNCEDSNFFTHSTFSVLSLFNTLSHWYIITNKWFSWSFHKRIPSLPWRWHLLHRNRLSKHCDRLLFTWFRVSFCHKALLFCYIFSRNVRLCWFSFLYAYM